MKKVKLPWSQYGLLRLASLRLTAHLCVCLCFSFAVELSKVTAVCQCQSELLYII